MNNTRQPASVLIIALIPVLLSLYSNILCADQEVITDDGREVLLRSDGTWKFRSTDRFANTADGQRIRLKEDGSWQYVGNAPTISKDQVMTTALAITLRKVIIEKHETKVQKNKRVKTQTVFYLDLGLSPLAASAITLNDNAASSIEVSDDNGRRYPVLSIQSGTTMLKPGSNTAIAVRVDDSPSWLDNARSMEILFKPDIFGIQSPIRLSQNIDDFEEVDVDGFETGE
jgi:hypothetical protein